MNIQRIIFETIIEKCGKTENNLYMYIKETTDDWVPKSSADCGFSCFVSQYPMGSWSKYASGIIRDDEFVIDIRSVRSVIFNTYQTDRFSYNICRPESIDSIIDLIHEAAKNFDKAYRLLNKRHWTRFERKIKKHNLEN